MTKRIDVIFIGSGPDAGHGVDLDDLRKVAEHLRNALRHVLADMMGTDISAGRPLDIIRAQSALRLVSASPGSLEAHFEVGRHTNGQAALEDHTDEAVTRILNSQNGGADMLPDAAKEALWSINNDLPTDIETVTVGEPNSRNRLRFTRKVNSRRQNLGADEEAVLFGWLREINWAQGTAQLHDWGGDHVNLSFDTLLADDMRQFATEFVRISGFGRIDESDSWGRVRIREITPAGSFNTKPFDLVAFLNDPNPKVFDPDKLVKIDLSDAEYESFVRAIEEGRGE